MSFPKYPAYKDSGVEWLGEVPEHWILAPLKHLALLNPRKSGYDGDTDQLCSFVPMEKLKTGVVQLDEERPIAEVIGGYTYFEDGDVLQAKVTPCFENKNIAIAKGLTNGVGFGSSEINVLRPYQGVIAEYLFYRVQEDSYMDFCTSSMIGAGGLRRVPTDVINNIKIAAPDLAEQTQIARFLDHETARIDALIEEQQRLIELLKEKRQAVISHAVTKGLDPTVPMKDSGVEWLGEVPAHWDVKNMKHISSLKGRLGWQGLKAEEYRDEGPFVVSSAHFNNFSIDWDACPHVSEERYDLDSNIQLCEGDVLLMKDGAALGKLAYIDHLPGRACLNSHLLLFRPVITNQYITYISNFLFFLMRTEYFQKHITLYATGTTFAGISQEKIGNYRMAIPPLEEQSAIVKFLEVEIAKFDTLIVEAQRTTDLLQERRSALISAAVTGKIDVRGWQPPVSANAPEHTTPMTA